MIHIFALIIGALILGLIILFIWALEYHLIKVVYTVAIIIGLVFAYGLGMLVIENFTM